MIKLVGARLAPALIEGEREGRPYVTPASGSAGWPAPRRQPFSAFSLFTVKHSPHFTTFKIRCMIHSCIKLFDIKKLPQPLGNGSLVFRGLREQS